MRRLSDDGAVDLGRKAAADAGEQAELIRDGRLGRGTMPTVRGRRFHIAAGLSLGLFLALLTTAVCSVFVQGYWIRQTIDRQRRIAWFPEVFTLDDGVAGYSLLRTDFDQQRLATYYSGEELAFGSWDGRWHYEAQSRRPGVIGGLTVFRLRHENLPSTKPGETMTATVIVLPLWLPLLLTSILPTIAMLRWRRAHRRLAAGRCRHCGYDLRASPDRCPECGAVNMPA